MTQLKAHARIAEQATGTGTGTGISRPNIHLVSVQFEKAFPAIKWHPMGAGNAYQENGITATCTPEQTKKVMAFARRAKWRASSYKKGRTDGKWFINLNDSVTVADRIYCPLLFVSKPEASGSCTMILKIITYRA